MSTGELWDSIRDEALARSNPVWYLDDVLADEPPQRAPLLRLRLAQVLEEHGVDLPQGLRHELSLSRATDYKPLRPGVVGLLTVERGSGQTALTCPLRAHLSDEWDIPLGLPFVARDLQGLLGDVLGSSGEELEGLVPESLTFSFQAPDLGQMHGRSMHVAGLLAVLNAVAQGASHELLRAACCTLMPTAGPGDGFRPVENVVAKLEAFVREYEQGSLLICAGDAEALRFKSHFAEVWTVCCWRDLAQHLQSRGLLVPLLKAGVLSERELARAIAWLEDLSSDRQLHERAWQFARRLDACVLANDVSLEMRVCARITQLRPLRLLGEYRSAAKESENLCGYLEGLRDLVSNEQLALAANTRAASLFFGHQFCEGIEVLRSWIDRIDAEPRLLSVKTRVHLLATFARLGSAVGLPESLRRIESAVDLQERSHSRTLRKTQGHLVEVLLRARLDSRAEVALASLWEAVRDEDPKDNIDFWFASFYSAELARRRGECWEEEAMERQDYLQERQAAHVMAYYFQATARQTGRDVQERAERLSLAAELCERNHVPGGLYGLLARLLRLAEASARNDHAAWAECSAQLREDCLETPELTDWYKNALDDLPEGPDMDSSERLLTRVPALLGRRP